MKSDHPSKFSNLSNWKEEAWKISGLQWDSNPWPTGAMLDQLSCEATHWEQGHFVEFISSCAVKCCEMIFFFKLLKVENLLQWSLFTFIYNRSTIKIMNFIYIAHHKFHRPWFWCMCQLPHILCCYCQNYYLVNGWNPHVVQGCSFWNNHNPKWGELWYYQQSLSDVLGLS